MEQQVKLLVLVSTVAIALLAVAGGIILYGSVSNDNVDGSDAISYSGEWKDYAEKLDQYGGYIVRAGLTYSESSSTVSYLRNSNEVSVSVNDTVVLKGDLLEISHNDTSNKRTEYRVIPLSQIQMICYNIPQQQ